MVPAIRRKGGAVYIGRWAYGIGHEKFIASADARPDAS